MPQAPKTLVELLRQRAEFDSQNLAYVFLEDDGRTQHPITYAELDRKAAALAQVLDEHGARGQRALLLYPPGLDFISAFFGCLYAGVTAVPAYPPRLNRPMPRIQAIVRDAQAHFALTTTQILGSVEKRFEHEPLLKTLDWVDTDLLAVNGSVNWEPSEILPDQLAFLQYTSGSTSTPKGVMLTHLNLMYNLEMIRHGFRIVGEERGVFWLPSYHDMGLIGGILEPMYICGPSMLLSPVAFLQRPVRWLQAISDFKATITGAPNFAFDMCVEKVTPEQRASLDLSSLRLCFTGAEPVRSETMAAFSEVFSGSGFSPSVFYPCYGLAEATLIAAGGAGPGKPVAQAFEKEALKMNKAVPAKDGPDAQVLVSSGRPLLEEQIVIVDPDDRSRCAEDQVGEIWISGSNVAQGYWERPDLNVELFQASLEETGEQKFLRTGDLGFFHQGDLFITGRLKDLMIIRGKNHYPQDIEQTLEQAHEALQVGACAAFSYEEGGQEKLAVVCETTRQHRRPDMEAIVPVLRRVVAENHAVRLSAITLVKPLSIPKTSSGKIKRQATRTAFLEGSLSLVGDWRQESPLEPPIEIREEDAGPAARSKESTEILAWIQARLAQKLDLPKGVISPDDPFVQYGLDSAEAVALTGDLETYIGRTLSPTLAWDYPTPRLLADFLSGPAERPAQVSAAFSSGSSPGEPVAIIGMACRFPGAGDLDSFWKLLHFGLDAISEIPADRFLADAFYDPDPAIPGKTNSRWGGFLENIDRFDPSFFGISPREAIRMDPQQRLLMEIAWEALESAGIAAPDLAGSETGVFVGISSYDYSRRQFNQPDRLDAYAGTGNAHSVAANRLSYFLDLRGPSVAVDTACSSSLVSVHMACQSLRTGETNLGIVGGVNLILSPELNITFSQARMLSPEGRCKTFDESADGYVRGEGCGVVVLKRFSDAQRDGDPIFALISGSAVNQDGRSNGLTAPNGPSQEAVIRQALDAAGIAPEAVGYVEAHGTGTPLGDPIEMHALANVLAIEEREQIPLFVGSVKTNFGHLEAAAGIAGLIKTALSLHHGEIPSHLHFKALNPYISLAGKPIRVPVEATPWPRRQQPRHAGVSSFGFGGTNAHLVLSEAPASLTPESAEAPPGTEILVLSARSEDALRALAKAYSHQDLEPFDDSTYTSRVGRAHFEFRLAVPAQDVSEARTRLQDHLEGRSTPRRLAGSLQPKIAFLFTGQGSQYPQMGQRLYQTSPTFRATLDRCAEILEPLLERSLFSVLFADRSDFDSALVHQTRYTQPSIFALEFATCKMWQAWGVEPDFLLGHSLGELAAACLAGVMSLEDGLRLVAARGRLMDAAPGKGGMLAAVVAEERARELAAEVPGCLGIAAVNGPDNVVLSGGLAELESLQQRFGQAGILSKFLEVSHAFHSQLMEPVQDEFLALAQDLSFSAPQLPLISNLDGQPAAVLDADYWTAQIRRPVRFYEGVRTLLENQVNIFLEVGPKPVLLGLSRRILNRIDLQELHLLASLDDGVDDWRQISEALAGLYELGLAIDWKAYQGERPARKVQLPSYPFQRERYWLETVPNPVLETPLHFTGRRLPVAVPLYELETSDLSQPALLQLALGAVEAFTGAAGRLSEIRFFQVGAKPASVHRLQIALQETADHTLGFRIFRANDRHDWEPIAEGAAQPGHTRMSKLTSLNPSQDTHPSRSAPSPSDLAPVPDPIAFLTEQLARTLGVEQSALQPDRPLNTLGLDSLMAMEVRSALEARFGVQLPMVRFLEGPTLQSLADVFSEHLESGRPGGSIPIHDPTGTHPLTHGQQALWFLHELTGEDISFNIAGAVRIRGDFDLDRFAAALQAVMQRQPALRTTFVLEAGEPVQQIDFGSALPLLELDASDWSDGRLEAYLRREAWRKFNLQEGPPFRVRVLRLSPPSKEPEWIVLFSVDHLVADFWSVSLILRDLLSHYLGKDPGSRLPTSESLKFVDFARWRQAELEGQDDSKHLDYWRAVIGDGSLTLQLPGDRPRPPLQTYHGESVHLRLPGQLARRLKELASRQGTTLFNVLLAAYQTFLYRYSGQESFLVGSVMAGRDHHELADLVGYFINPVALRADFRSDQTFLEVLESVRGRVLEAFEHQDYPPALLMEHLGLPRDLSRPPLFETMFIFQKAQVLQEHGFSAFAVGVPGSVIPFSDLEMEIHPLTGQPAQFDLTLMMAEAEDTLLASLQYNTALFDEKTVRRMLDHFQVLLEGIGAQPGSRVQALPLIPEQELEQLNRWNQTQITLPEFSGVHQMFEACLADSAHRTALVFEDQSLTYEELDQRANRVAHLLQQRGVNSNTLVGVYIQRSADMLVAILAILKAGGAYVPLDPSYPESRIAYMVADSELKLILSQGPLHESSSFVPAEWIDLDSVDIETASDTFTSSVPAPGDLAYVIYTSGSTGRPKGVQVPHRAVVNFLHAMALRPGIQPHDRLLAVTTLSFDISVLELILPLTVGATVVIVGQEHLRDGVALAALMEQEAITVMQATPVTWRLMLETGWEGKADLKVLCGGEAMPADLAEELLPRCAELWNMYGPTETTVWSTVQRVKDVNGSVSIGRPILNTEVFVLDSEMQPAPIGVFGELLIAGRGLANGYLKRDDLTREKFIEIPSLGIGNGSGEGEGFRVYRTGDAARWLPDGTLEFAGRIDSQVKVRGFRIELGEVEASMNACEGVRQSAAALFTDGGGQPAIAGYLVLDADQDDISTAELRSQMGRTLPDYMLPSRFVILEQLPLTLNGKVDRKALPEPGDPQIDTGVPYLAPRNETEARLAELCGQVLGIERVGVRDNFFDLGGNSLQATRLVFQVREIFGANLMLRRLFEQPTVEGLAAAIEAAKAHGQKGFGLLQGMSLEELAAEVELDEAIHAGDRDWSPGGPPRRILLTGSTGFLGAYLLRELLEATPAEITCLVRADSKGAALSRVRGNLEAYGIWDEATAGRLRPLPGDLTQPLLGLDESNFERLADEIDVIYHNGARVNFIHTFEDHQPANVLGTQEILRLAASGKLKPVHFISTLSVFHTGNHDLERVYSESEVLEQTGAPLGGYAQSKWVAEQMVRLAGQRGIPVSIYRPGVISGHSQTGGWNHSDLIWSLGRACLAIGKVPGLSGSVDVVPVDYVSQAIVEIGTRVVPNGRAFHLGNPVTYPYEEMVDLVRRLGLPVDVVPFEQWREALFRQSLAEDGTGDWNAFLPIIEEVEIEQIFMPHFGVDNTLEALSGSGISCPPVGPELLSHYLKFFNEVGFIE